MAHRRCGPDRLVCSLRILFLFEGIRGFGQIGRTVFFADVLAHFLNGFGRYSRGIGTHVGDQADEAFFPEFDAFIQALGDHHGALHAEAQLARGILLQFAGGERRRCVAATLFLVDRAYNPVGLFQSDANLFGVLAVGDFDLLFASAHEPRIETRGLAGGQVRIDRPVFFFLECFDLAFAFDDQSESNGLHTTRG